MRHLPPLHQDSGPEQERPRRAGRGRTSDYAIEPLGPRARIRKASGELAGNLDRHAESREALETQLERELENTRVQCRRDGSKGRIPNDCIGRAERRSIRDIKGLGPELEMVALRKCESF